MSVEQIVEDHYGKQHLFEQLHCGCKALDHQTWVYCNDHLPWKKEPSLIKEELSKNQLLKEKEMFGYPLNPIEKVVVDDNVHGVYTWKITDQGAKLESVKTYGSVQPHATETTSGNVPGTPAPKSVSTVELRKKRLSGFQKMCRSLE